MILQKLLVVSLLLVATACSNKPSQLQIDISEGIKPTVSVVMATRDGIATEFIGMFAFQNKSKIHPSIVRSTDLLTAQIEGRVRSDAVVTPVEVPRDAMGELSKIIDSPLHKINLSYAEDSDRENVGRWSHAEKVDYLIFILPLESGNPFHNSTGSVNGGGLLVVDQIYKTSFIVGAYELVVFDTNTLLRSEVGRRVMFNQVRNYGRGALSPKHLKAVTQKYQADMWSHRYEAEPEPGPIEERIRRAELFHAKDFDSLSQETIQNIEEKVRRLAYLAIEDILGELGILKAARKYQPVTYIPATEEVYRRFVPMSRQGWSWLILGPRYWELPD